MSETAERVTQHSDEERASPDGTSKTPTGTLGKIGSTLRSSIRRVAERSPLSPAGKGSKVTSPSPIADQNQVSDGMERVSQHSDEERASLASNGKTPTGKKTLGKIGSTLRSSIRRMTERSPLSPEDKGLKVTPGTAAATSTPPSPSPSSASMKTSSLIAAEDNGSPQTPGGLRRSQTVPNMPRPGASIVKRMTSGRRSLGFGAKKEKNKNLRRDLAVGGAAGASATQHEEPREEVLGEEVVEQEEEEEEKEEEELDEAYTLPDIPHTPISVMQISNLIKMEILEEAHLNLLAMRQELRREQETCSEDLPMEIVRKEQDLNLLYGDLRNKLADIVRDSSLLPARNKGLLVYVARIIQEEEKRAKEPGGPPGGWMESWREAVGLGVRAKVGSVHLDTREQNASWLSVHLGLLGKAIVEDLEKVRRELRCSYPSSFKVFGTYVASYHSVVGEHLKKLEQQAADLRDLHALLNWIINGYKSERIMGSPSLRPDMETESSELLLEEGFLNRLKDKYCCRLKGDLRFALDRITELQKQDFWVEKKSPEKEDNYLTTELPMDIWTQVRGKIVNAGHIDGQLEKRVIFSCMEELSQFPGRFEKEFRHHCDALRPQPLWVEYHVSYINSFTALLENCAEYQDSCPTQVEAFRRRAAWLVDTLLRELEVQFIEDVKPYLRRMLTRKWLTNDNDFKLLRQRTERLSQDCAAMRAEPAKGFASRLHLHVVREYVGQLMKKNYSCKNGKHERAASKIREQLDDLQDLFQSDAMKSEHEFLLCVGDDLSDIIGQKNKRNIKNQLLEIVKHYPDFSKKHLAAVLHFRGVKSGRERQLILQKLSELRRSSGRPADSGPVLFGDMQVAADGDCLSDLPFSCLDLLRAA